jgi:hypothetical protein
MKPGPRVPGSELAGRTSPTLLNVTASALPPSARPAKPSSAGLLRAQSAEVHALQALHPQAQKKVLEGKVVVDPVKISAAAIGNLATKCVICKQTLIAKHAEGYQLAFPKSHLLKGFAVTERDSRVKGQRKDQPFCLQCVGRQYGQVLESADRLAITVARVGWVGPAEVWFERSSSAQPWRQLKALLAAELQPLISREQEAKQAFGGRRTSTAAEAALNRGRNAGEIPRAKAPSAVRVLQCLCSTCGTD